MHEERLKILKEVREAQKPKIAKGPNYRPVHYERAKRREMKKMNEVQKKRQKKLELINKRKQYGQYVNEFFLPKINPNGKILFYSNLRSSRRVI